MKLISNSRESFVCTTSSKSIQTRKLFIYILFMLVFKNCSDFFILCAFPRFCTVLEYCDGNDLDFLLKQHKTISEKEVKYTTILFAYYIFIAKLFEWQNCYFFFKNIHTFLYFKNLSCTLIKYKNFDSNILKNQVR
jgi:hypothetical protein